jgi:hypothetical protein
LPPQFYCKHGRINGKLERAEINPKKQTTVCSYDSSTDVFKINLVYKDAKGLEHELKWVIKVTRSDLNKVADDLLKHEKQEQYNSDGVASAELLVKGF